MIDLRNVKIAFIDVDGTLAIPRFKNNDGQIKCAMEDNVWFNRCNSRTDMYKYCIKNKKLEDFMIKLKNNGTIFYVLTEETNSGAYFNKIDFVLSNYPEIFNDYHQILFVDNKNKKSDLMKTIANKNNINKNKCLLIDDTYSVCQKASINGFSVMHISELFAF